MTDTKPLDVKIKQKDFLRRNIFPVASIILTGCLFYVLVVSNLQRPSAPVELIGLWVTSAPGYEDRYLSITDSAIVFGRGSADAEGQAVRKIETIQEGTRILYIIAYGSSRGKEQLLSFYYDPVQRVITFRNQSHLTWKKKVVAS